MNQALRLFWKKFIDLLMKVFLLALEILIIIFLVPFENFGFSKTPIGPFQIIVLASMITILAISYKYFRKKA